ncbi:methionine--tRNA ligase [Candidatus Falkowbacteria bacterium CG10_big_fil_rev_8_21_14_0_10_39_9]|uniref:methionine--tRNA ligase n=1 Tax=Candidatus Falkowbacteria bacterium CG10_big_fil_rev_8_21_14_0_10_39_9 TaxID=1974566 RepID=A0A2M6WPP8_9BACT|nr:MAG: methionine--tRNA ligase [Candidatus Falkowbacteria bacterium CG10_big_fil_rev_8_21_14_0_10_39_9]
MSANKKFYITTTLPYINAEPHIGFAAEIIRADAIARFQRLIGKEVFFNTGTDEHGLKIWRKAQEAKMDIQDYCDSLAVKFNDLKSTLNLSFDNFIRTTDTHHLSATQEFWNRCLAKGDIYKKNYQVKYCVGCELEKTESELINGRCQFHPDKDLEIIEEENYFFRFSAYQKPLLDLYNNNPDIVIPHHRFTEIKNFVASGLQDFSISRLKAKMPWGVEVPGDPEQVMYVWFDALVNYISCLGWPEDEAQFKAFWPGVQVCGKDNLRQQTAMWQAMLLSAGLPNSKQVLIFGFITNNGQKMSKSLGNVVDPFSLVEKFGIDAVRYYFLREIQAFEDSDFSEENLAKLYNADLANGLGNLAARTSNLLEKNEIKLELTLNSDEDLAKAFINNMSEYSFSESLRTLWDKVKASDEFLSQTTPWKLEGKEEIKTILKPVAQNILNIAYWLEPFMPETAKKIKDQFSAAQITKGDVLFPRLS